METKNKATIKYQSKGKTPAGDPFMTVKVARKYYEYAERGGQDSIFFILMDKNYDGSGETKYCLINESKPPMDERFNKEVRMTTAFGGSVDMDCSLEEICQTEVKEESGYEVPMDRIGFVGDTMVSTQMSQLANGYLVNVTGIEKTCKAEYESKPISTLADPTEFSGNSVVWMSVQEVLNNGDWKSIYIVAKSVI